METPDDGVGPQPGLVVRPVQIDQGTVHGGQIAEGPTAQSVGDLPVHTADGPEHAQAAETTRIAVAPFDSFPGTGGRSRGDAGPGPGAVLELHGDGQGGSSPGVEYLESVYGGHSHIHRFAFRRGWAQPPRPRAR